MTKFRVMLRFKTQQTNDFFVIWGYVPSFSCRVFNQTVSFFYLFSFRENICKRLKAERIARHS